MKKLTATGVVAFVALFALTFGTPVQSVRAQSVDAQIQALVAQLAVLQAQLAALQGGTASVTFTTDLTIGSTGVQVTALQNYLIGKGLSIPAGATGYFGPQTQSALAAFQAKNSINPPAGYFGPITRAFINSQVVVTPPTNGGGNGGVLSGGAGSVDDYTLISSLNNEEVGEDEEDQEVVGLEIEVDDGSDIRLTAVRLVFDEDTASSDFEDYASEVALFLDGKEVARVDADEFNDDNNWTQTISLEKDAIIDRGDTGELTVAISGARNIDSADLGDTWTVDFRQIRFEDADGAFISEDPGTAPRSFSFESFATAGNVELKISEDDDDINDQRTIEVDATDDTDNVPVMSFTLEAKGDSDLEIKNWAVSVSVTGASNTDDVISGLSLWIDGDEVAVADTVSGGGSSHDYIFDDVDYTIDAGDKVDVEIRADFLSIADALDEGDTISFALGEDQTDVQALVEVEDESGEELGDADISGSVNAGAFELRSAGIIVTFVSASESVNVSDGSDNDSAQFVIKYNVEAFGDTVYVSNSAAATTANSIVDDTISTSGVLFLLDEAGTATTEDISSVVTFTPKTGVTASGIANGVRINEGRNADFTLTVVRTNDGDVDDDGLYRVLLKAIGWATTDTSTFNVYDFNLEDFKTDYISVN